jgi:hypothetical protein
MPPWVIDLVVIVLSLGILYALASEGLWGAALMSLNILFSILLALNFYEPLAGAIAGMGEWATGYADTFSLLIIFVVSLWILRITTDSIAPTMVRFPMPVYHLGRLVFGAFGSVLTIAFLLLAFHTSPVHKKMFGVIDYKYAPPYGMGWDHRLLGFFQATTGQVFARFDQEQNDPYGQYFNANIFDRKGEWLIVHQNARPYGKDTVPEPEAEAAPAGGGDAGGGGGGGAGGGPPGGGRGGRGGPGGQASEGMGIPGGTGGAAVGLAPNH